MTNSEHSIAQAEASIMMYDEPKKRWQPILPGNTLSSVNVTHHITSNTFKIVGRSTTTREVIISCNIVKNLKYNQATATFHQWRDQKTIFGLNFPSNDDADNFALGIRNALEILSRDVPAHITQQMPPPSQPPALPPRKNSSPHVMQMLEPKYINVDDNIIEKIREKDNAMTKHLCSGDASSNENSIYDPVMIPTEHSRDMYSQNGGASGHNLSYSSPGQQNNSANNNTHHRVGSYNKSHTGSNSNLGIGQYGDDADDRVSIYSTSTNSSNSSGAGNQHAVDYALSSAAFPPPAPHSNTTPQSAAANTHHRGSSTGSAGAAEAAKCINPPTGGPIAPSQYIPAPPQPPPPQSAPAPPAAPTPPNNIPVPPPAPPPMPADDSPESDAPQGSFAAMLAGVKLKKTNKADDSSVTPSGTLKHAATSAATPSTPKAAPVASSAAGGGGGGGFMSEMSKLLAKRKQIAEGESSGSSSQPSTLKSAEPSRKSESVISSVPMAVGSLNRRKSINPSEITHSSTPLSLHSGGSSLTSANSSSVGAVGSTNAATTAAIESMKQEILATVRAEIQAAKLEILQAIRAQNR